jgi:chromosomal replication initiation ATPase DnaA
MEANIMDQPKLEQQLIEEFLNRLEALPEVQATLHPEKLITAVARIDLKVAGKALTLLVETKKVAYPRDVQQVLAAM